MRNSAELLRAKRGVYRLRHRVLPHVTDHFTEGEAQYLVMQLFRKRPG